MYNTLIGEYCATHDDWENELAAAPYYLKIKYDGRYVMFSYNQLASDFNNELVREARGIIFRTGEWDYPVCWAFNKFGNYGESYAPEIDWETAMVTEKIDGSLIKVWYDEKWHVSTNGTIDAYLAEIGDAKMKNFGDYFELAIQKYYGSFEEFTQRLGENLTYMFELVGPYNRVVIPYEEVDVYYLGARSKVSGVEYRHRSGINKLPTPKEYPLTSLEDCVRAAEEMEWDSEGFVVVDGYGNRVKIKSPAYVMAHFARNNNVITRKHLLQIILSNETAEFLCYASDYAEELQAVQDSMNEYKETCERYARALSAAAAMLERRIYAKFVMALPKVYWEYLFLNYERLVSAEEYTKDWDIHRWDRTLEEA